MTHIRSRYGQKIQLVEDCVWVCILGPIPGFARELCDNFPLSGSILHTCSIGVMRSARIPIYYSCGIQGGVKADF